MKQHPIPQDITNYKFHLIGSMTLKQFAEMAVSVVIAFIIYKTNLIGIVKWPLIFLSVGLGAALAFVPIEERPLDHWIQTFFKNIYRPTKFFWKKASKIPDFFTYKITSTENDFFAPNVNLNPARARRISEYIKSIPDEEASDTFDAQQDQRISQLINEFDSVPVKQENVSEQEPKNEKPSLQTRVRKLKAPDTQSHQANQIYGSVLDQNGQAIAQALIEVKDDAGKSLRITKTDQAGHFVINRNLNNGHYQITAEKNDTKSKVASIELQGQTLDPLVIKV